MKIFLLPGFLLDNRVYSRLDLPEHTFLTPNFIPPRSREGMRDYALRFARHLGFTSEDVIGGVSFGGMVASEIASSFKSRRLILISSTRDSHEVNSVALRLAYLVPFLPVPIMKRLLRLMPLYLKWRNILSGNSENLLMQMVADFPGPCLKRFPGMMLHWKSSPVQCPITHIHASHDWLIKVTDKQSITECIDAPNHILPFSHPDRIRKILIQLASETDPQPSR